VTLEELLAEHRPEIAELAERVINHVDQSGPWSEMRVYAGWHGVGFHHAELGYVIGVFPGESSVRVLFEHGNLLGEAPFLSGTGQTRFVDFDEWSDERIETVDDLLARAIA
jgi:hypothetical protein